MRFFSAGTHFLGLLPDGLRSVPGRNSKEMLQRWNHTPPLFPADRFLGRTGQLRLCRTSIHPCMNRYPRFTHGETHPLFSMLGFLSLHPSIYLPLHFSFFFCNHVFSLLCPTVPLCLGFHPSLPSSLQPPGHFRQAVCSWFINRLFPAR